MSQSVHPAAVSSSSSTKLLLVSNQDRALYRFRLPIACALREHGCEVVLVCPRDEYAHLFEEEGFRVIDWRLSRRSLNPVTEVLAIRQLVHIYRQQAPHAVHHFTIKPNLYGAIAARRAGVPIIMNTWEGLGFIFTPSLRARALRALLLPLMRRTFRTEKLWTTFVNRENAGLFEQLRLTSPERVQLFPSVGVNTDRFTPGEERHTDTPVVLMASRLLWDKGTAEFVEAARLLSQKGVEARFWLCGSPDKGNPRFIPERTLDRWRQEGFVEMLGQRDDMPHLLRQADIAVLPSYHEGIPTTLLEAAAAGLPLVATDVQGCRLVARDGINGLLVQPRDVTTLVNALQRLLQDEPLRKRFGKASRGIAVEEFSTSVIVDKYLETYRRVGVLGQAVHHG